MRKKPQKPVWGVYASQDWSQKKALAKRICFYKRYILRKHPQIAKTNGFKVWKIGSFDSFQFFTKGVWPKLNELESESDIFA